MASIRDLRIGRLLLPTTLESLAEALGDEVSVTGAAVSQGERAARAFALSVPVRGAGDTDPLLAGERMRRQARSLLDNARARAEGLYLAFDPDPEQNGWLQIGASSLEYGQAGVTIADYLLKLSNTFRVGQLRTHRPAWRLQIADRTDGQTARDVLGQVSGTDFGDVAFTGSTLENWGPRVPVVTPQSLPPVLGAGAGLYPMLGAMTAIAVRDGSSVVPHQLLPAYDGAVIAYDLEEARLNRNPGDVVVYDRRGSATLPTSSADPEDAAGWEEVYGPNHPLSQTGLVLENGLVRVRPSAAAGVWAIDKYVPGATDAWVAEGEIIPVTGLAGFGAPRVMQWTPERCVIAVSSEGSTRYDLYVTLQRGWAGPRFELYGRAPVGWATPTCTLRYVSSFGGVITAAKGTPGASPTTWVSTGSWAAQNRGDFSAALSYPYVGVQSSTPHPAGDTRPRTVLGLQHKRVAVFTQDDTTYGPTRKAVELQAQTGTPAAGYCSVQVGFAVDDGATWADARDQARSQLFDVQRIPELLTR